MLRLELVDISKSYPAVKANDRVSLRVAPGADPRRARRERRRQVDADEDHLRRRPARRRRDALERRARRGGVAGRGAGARHQHGLPALQPVRHADGGRERLARARQVALARRGHGADQEGRRRIRPRGRPAAAGAHALGRRAPARRDRARADDGAQAAHPRRADLGADAAGGADALRDAAKARRRGLLDPLHLAQARRDPRPLPSLHGAARRQGHRRGRSDEGDQRQPVAPDDRRRAAAAAASRSTPRRGRARRARPHAGQGGSVRHRARGRSRSTFAPARWSASPASPATASRS